MDNFRKELLVSERFTPRDMLRGVFIEKAHNKKIVWYLYLANILKILHYAVIFYRFTYSSNGQQFGTN